MTDVIVQGKKFKPSNRPSSDVKVGDWVKIVFPGGTYQWDQAAMDMIGKVYKVKDSNLHNSGVRVECGYSFTFNPREFVIMEEIPEQNKIPRNHPHADMIRQWLDDASLEVEWFDARSKKWFCASKPLWDTCEQYRFKPKTIPAWKVLYEIDGDMDLTHYHYKIQSEFEDKVRNGEKFIKFVLETEKQIEA